MDNSLSPLPLLSRALTSGGLRINSSDQAMLFRLSKRLSYHRGRNPEFSQLQFKLRESKLEIINLGKGASQIEEILS